MPKTLSPIFGRWRFTGMDQWDVDFMDLEVPAFIAFGADGRGEFHFGCVHCCMEHRLTEREGKPATEWTFEGHDEGDPVSGRGWAVLEDGGSLRGEILFHEGDDSGFTANRQCPQQERPRRKGR